MAKHQFTIYVNNLTQIEVRPPKGQKRSYLFLQNRSAADIYKEEDTAIQNTDNADVISAGQNEELSENLGKAVPTGSVWILGSVAAPALQAVRVVQA